MYYYKDIAAHCQVSRRVIHVNGEVKSSVHVNERGWGRYENHIWEGMAAERRVLRGALPQGQGVSGVALRSTATLRLSRRRSCAAYGCGSSRVAASGGQGGLGGL